MNQSENQLYCMKMGVQFFSGQIYAHHSHRTLGHGYTICSKPLFLGHCVTLKGNIQDPRLWLLLLKLGLHDYIKYGNAASKFSHYTTYRVR